MLAQGLAIRLGKWNTVCTLGSQTAYREWLLQHFGHWQHASDFSTLSVETVDPSGQNMLWRDDYCYICWRSPDAVMTMPSEFVAAGLLMVGSTANGDLIVIDTHEEGGLVIGFVSHDALWEQNAKPRDAYTRWHDDLLTFLDRLDVSPGYADQF